MIERRRLIGHQPDPRDPARAERRAIDREYAQIDDRRREQLAAAIDDLSIVGLRHDQTVAHAQLALATQHIGIHETDRPGRAHAHPSTPRA